MINVLQKFLDDLNRLVEAENLLKQVWLDIGPYGFAKVTKETLEKINKFYNFDDSE